MPCRACMVLLRRFRLGDHKGDRSNKGPGWGPKSAAAAATGSGEALWGREGALTSFPRGLWALHEQGRERGEVAAGASGGRFSVGRSDSASLGGQSGSSVVVF